MMEKLLARLNIIKTLFEKNKFLSFSILFFIIAASAAIAIIFVSQNKVPPALEEVSKQDNLATASEETFDGHYVEQEVKASEPILKPHSEVLDPKSLFNVLVLGIDRRFKEQESYRTDILLLATVNPTTNKVVLTSIPRDLWAGDMKINGVYVTYGYDAMKTKIKEITDQEVDRFIRIDFDALVWVVDVMGGVDVNVERAFTDTQYPNDRQGLAEEGISVSFSEGLVRMDGETALIFSRSRKGDNGEGSDFSRMRRQQVLLKNIPESFLSANPKNIFNPFVLQSFYNLITQHIKTDMNVKDVGVVYDLLKDRNKYTVRHFVVDYEYLVNPPIGDYGQWVVVPKNGDYTPIHNQINLLLQ